MIIAFDLGLHDDDDGGNWDSHMIWAGDSTSYHAGALLRLEGEPIPSSTPTRTATPTNKPTPTHTSTPTATRTVARSLRLLQDRLADRCWLWTDDRVQHLAHQQRLAARVRSL